MRHRIGRSQRDGQALAALVQMIRPKLILDAACKQRRSAARDRAMRPAIACLNCEARALSATGHGHRPPEGATGNRTNRQGHAGKKSAGECLQRRTKIHPGTHDDGWQRKHEGRQGGKHRDLPQKARLTPGRLKQCARGQEVPSDDDCQKGWRKQDNAVLPSVVWHARVAAKRQPCSHAEAGGNANACEPAANRAWRSCGGSLYGATGAAPGVGRCHRHILHPALGRFRAAKRKRPGKRVALRRQEERNAIATLLSLTPTPFASSAGRLSRHTYTAS